MRPAHLADACLFYDPVTARKMVDAGIPSERVFCAPNAIRPGQNGLFYEDGDPEDFAAQLVGLAGSPERRQAMSTAATESVTGSEG